MKCLLVAWLAVCVSLITARVLKDSLNDPRREHTWNLSVKRLAVHISHSMLSHRGIWQTGYESSIFIIFFFIVLYFIYTIHTSLSILWNYFPNASDDICCCCLLLMNIDRAYPNLQTDPNVLSVYWKDKTKEHCFTGVLLAWTYIFTTAGMLFNKMENIQPVNHECLYSVCHFIQ